MLISFQPLAERVSGSMRLQAAFARFALWRQRRRIARIRRKTVLSAHMTSDRMPDDIGQTRADHMLPITRKDLPF